MPQRHDSGAVGTLPLGIVPAGSGNGLAMSLMTRGGEKCDPVSATLAIIRGRVSALFVLSTKQHVKLKYACRGSDSCVMYLLIYGSVDSPHVTVVEPCNNIAP